MGGCVSNEPHGTRTISVKEKLLSQDENPLTIDNINNGVTGADSLELEKSLNNQTNQHNTNILIEQGKANFSANPHSPGPKSLIAQSTQPHHPNPHLNNKNNLNADTSILNDNKTPPTDNTVNNNPAASNNIIKYPDLIRLKKKRVLAPINVEASKSVSHRLFELANKFNTTSDSLPLNFNSVSYPFIHHRKNPSNVLQLTNQSAPASINVYAQTKSLTQDNASASIQTSPNTHNHNHNNNNNDNNNISNNSSNDHNDDTFVVPTGRAVPSLDKALAPIINDRGLPTIPGGMPAPIMSDEETRLEAVRKLNLLDKPIDPDFQNLVDTVCQKLKVPICAISLVDEERQFFVAQHGLNVRQTDRDCAFCAHAIWQPQYTMVVNDSAVDRRFADNELVVSGPLIKFYAGFPLMDPSGRYAIGTLCAIDTVPHPVFSVGEEGILKKYAEIVQQKIIEKTKNNPEIF